METSTADVVTSSPERYAKQLASHLGRKAEIREEAAGTRIVIGSGSCLLVSGSSLVLQAQAPDAESLERVKDVIGRHLERFGAPGRAGRVMGLIGVTGATGRVGGLVASALRERGVAQRLLVRDPARVEGFADVAASSYDEPAGLEGISTLLMVSAAEHPDRVGQHLRFLDAVAAAGVERVVYTSFLNAAPDATFTLARHHWATEEKLAQLGIPFVALRDSLYADFLPLMKAADGVIRGPAGTGLVAPVAIADVAASAVGALLDPAVVGRFDITGPRLVTFAEAAALAGATFEDETVEQAWASRRGLAEDWEVEGWVSSYLAVRSGELATVGDGVQLLTGRAPTSLEDLLGR